MLEFALQPLSVLANILMGKVLYKCGQESLMYSGPLYKIMQNELEGYLGANNFEIHAQFSFIKKIVIYLNSSYVERVREKGNLVATGSLCRCTIFP